MQNILIERIQRIDYLIRIKGTGKASELAERLNISRAMVYHYINLMRQNGAPIKYDSYRETYYYSYEGAFTIQFMPSIATGSSHTNQFGQTA